MLIHKRVLHCLLNITTHLTSNFSSSKPVLLLRHLYSADISTHKVKVRTHTHTVTEYTHRETDTHKHTPVTVGDKASLHHKDLREMLILEASRVRH